MSKIYVVTGRLPAKKLRREFDFSDDYGMKEFIKDWSKHGITKWKIEVKEAQSKGQEGK